MDWAAGITGNYFIEKKSLYNTRAQKFVIARPWITVFDTDQLKALYEAKNRLQRGDGSWYEVPVYKHVSGGDQANNEGILVPCREGDGYGRRLWEVARDLK